MFMAWRGRFRNVRSIGVSRRSRLNFSDMEKQREVYGLNELDYWRSTQGGGGIDLELD